MKKNFSFIFRGKRCNIKVKECRNFFSKGKGLMFSKNSEPLLFIFNKKTHQSIHSFFCRAFIAIWFNRDKIIEVRNINRWRFSIRPREKYDKLLEIPINNINYKIILDDMRKI